ncbi:HEPN domain-containing protein [Pseudanabaena sp. ABRG5-3]|uniref:HEPN domain-containing protein n=1 Tax=Pseudanabaena sp. ABRG5-3 TaxID=685565 RepID=UPI000DC6EEDF|nr:HEPN domain-containing protein [Pseudanabaena sp. ABRG5-3]BBC22345.1 HEPN domain protein [Pseudanabaena sp. ABRG5-3]
MNELAKFLLLSNDDLETAQLLCNCGRYRSAISRAYYAMFYMTQYLLLSQGLDTSTYKGVLKMLSLHFVKTGKIPPSVADLLREAYDARQACDYESDMTEDEEMAKNVIANAQTFISEVRMLLS